MRVAITTMEGATIQFLGARVEFRDDTVRVWVGGQLVCDEPKARLRSWRVDADDRADSIREDSAPADSAQGQLAS